MASTQRVEQSCQPKSNNSSKSCFQPTQVCLKDWWLIRAEKDSQGRTLAVAGLTSRQGQALRVFSSAPIRKIYDVFNLETIDGICVVLKGFINKSRSEENGFPSEVFEQFLFGFPPQWEAFNESCLGRESKGKAAASDALGSEKPSVCSEKVKDLKKIDQEDPVEATDEIIQDHNGSKDYEEENNLMRDNQNDGEVASEVIVQKKTKRATRSSDKVNSTSIAKEQAADVKRATHFQSANIEATGEIIQDHNEIKDYEVEDNLLRDNQNDGEVVSEVIAQKKSKRATRSSDKLNSTNTSTSIAKEQTADVKRATHFESANVEASGEIIQDHNGSKDHEVEDNLMRDNQNDGEVASEVIAQKKTKRATRSSDKLNSTNTSTSFAKEQTADVKRATHFKSANVEATGEIIQDHNGSKDYEVEDNQNDGEVIVQKKTKKAMRSLDKLNSTNTSTNIAKEQTTDVKRATHSKSASASVKNAKRKLTYGSPQQGKKAVPLISPEPLSFNRSRSGRVLLPPMAFWRNQRAVYDADQRVTEVKQGDPNDDNLSRVSGSEPSKKKRQRR